jgi:hypothetical protein
MIGSAPYIYFANLAACRIGSLQGQRLNVAITPWPSLVSPTIKLMNDTNKEVNETWKGKMRTYRSSRVKDDKRLAMITQI